MGSKVLEKTEQLTLFIFFPASGRKINPHSLPPVCHTGLLAFPYVYHVKIVGMCCLNLHLVQNCVFYEAAVAFVNTCGFQIVQMCQSSIFANFSDSNFKVFYLSLFNESISYFF